MKRWKYSFLCYIRDKRLLAVTALYYAYLLFRLWELTFKYVQSFTLLEYLKEIERLSMYGCIFLLLCSYLYISDMSEHNYSEILKVGGYRYRNYIKSRLCVLGQVGILTGIIISAASIMACIKIGVKDGALVIHFLLNLVLYVFTPLLLGILLGTAIGLWLTYKWAYPLIVILWFGITPVSETIAVQLKGSGINLYTVINYLKLGAPDLQYAINNLYGIPIETFQWALRIFWIMGAAYLILYKMRKNEKIFRNVVLCIGIACLPFLIFQGSRIQQENGVKSGASEWESYYTEEWEKYNENRSTVVKAEQVKYRVQEYDMNLKLGKELTAKAVMNIQSPQKEMCFTLFEGYEVKKVKDKEGNKVAFERDGHYIKIKCENKELLEQVSFEYAGHSQKFYSNNQGAYLPGYFPYYPMPGKRSLLTYARTEFKDGYGDYASYNTDMENFNLKDFKLKIAGANKNIYTNLDKQSGDTWSGKAQTITILSGLVQEERVGSRNVVGAIGNWDIKNSAERLAQACADLKSKWNLEVNTQYEKIFMIDPMMNYMGAQGENTVDLGDHIIVTMGDDAVWALELLLNPITENGDKELLKETLKYRMLNGFEEREADLQMEMRPTETIDSELMDYYLNYKVTQYGEQRVIREILEYLNDIEAEENPQVFLKQM